MKKYLLSLSLTIILFSACKKDSSSSPDNDTSPSPEFKLDNANAYLNQKVNFNVSSSGTYTWDFGDGSTTNSTSSATHTFTKAGTYSVTMKSGVKAYSKKIRIFPGECSLQLKNSYSASLNNLSPYFFAAITGSKLSDYQFQPTLKVGATTDTIFVSYPTSVSYDAGMAVTFSFTNLYSKNVTFNTSVFTPIRGLHLVFEIKPTVTGAYTYSSINNTFISGFGPLSDVWEYK